MSALLIVDDEPVLAHQLAVALRSNGHEVMLAETAAKALEEAERGHPEIVLLDMRLPDRSGLELIPVMLDLDPSMMIVLMTAYGSAQDAVEALRRGAADYLHKPLNLGELGFVIERLLRGQRRERELSFLRESTPSTAAAFLPESLLPVLDEALRLCDRSVSPGRRPPLLLVGESGCGRRELAEAIHQRMGNGSFLAVPCTAFDGTRLAEELFGVEADSERGQGSIPGLFEVVDGGTLLLEEISALPVELQAPLLRVIKHRRVRRVGSDRDHEVNVQLLASTSADLVALEKEAGFLPELSRALRGLCFEVQPLRRRLEDVPRLAQQLASALGLHFDGEPRRLQDAAVVRLAEHDWPGNVPELRNLIERAVFLSEGDEIGAPIVGTLLQQDGSAPGPGEIVLPENGILFEDLERDLLRQALARARGNRTRAAALLGMSRDTFRYRIARLGVDDRGTRENGNQRAENADAVEAER